MNPAGLASAQHRRYYRHKLGSLAYVNLNQANGGIVRDLSEAGLALQAVAPVRMGEQVHLRVDLSPRLHIETAGRVAWTGSRGAAGIEFLAPGQRPRRLLQQWMFTQLLLRANQTFSPDSIFACDRQAEDAPELHFSANSRPSIRLDSMARAAPSRRFAFLRSPRGLALLLDGLALALGVLLCFAVLLAMLPVAPAGPVEAEILAASALLLGGLYFGLFSLSKQGTPGARVAGLRPMNSQPSEDDRPRFR
ncbi:MAG TPA: PilZ domain-containing protein [Terriglobales bacterium]|nr:PilZ domain-containing protein [Terriglobales bacterium]